MVLGLAACSAKDPDPSRLYDGHYVGTRQSERLDACGVSTAHGTTFAQVTDGRLTMPLFSPQTQLDGTVGEDGRVRASGIWRTPTERYPQVTVLNGAIRNDVLEGRASDFQCITDLKLHKVMPRHPRNRAS